MIKQNNSFFLIIFILLAIILRFFSFFPSVLDHDESTYLLMARDIFERGKVLYSDVIDTKPPGIFLLFGMIQKITGTSIFLFRLTTAVIVGFTSWMIYQVSLIWLGKKKVAIATGFIYLFFVSTWKDFGISPNTELFFSLFNILGLYFLLRKRNLYLFVSGLFFGFGFITKYNNLYDFVPIIGNLILYLDYKRVSLKQQFIQLVLAGFGFALPFLLANLYFYLNGNFEEFKFITYHVPLNYAQSKDIVGIFDRLLDFHVFFLPVFFFFYYAAIKKNEELKSFKRFIVVWICCVMWSIISMGNTFPHYFIQLMLPVSLLAGCYFDQPYRPVNFLRYMFSPRFGWGLLGLFIAVKLFADFKDYYKKPDYGRQVAEYLNSHTTSEDVIYTGNYHQIIYFLTGKDSPTPYIHWSILYWERLQSVMQIDNKKEVDLIFSQKPKYVVVDGKLKEDFFVNIKGYLDDSYSIEKTFGSKISLYVHADTGE